MIRKITRGTNYLNNETGKTISCSITDPDKTIIILDPSTTSNTTHGVYVAAIATTGFSVYARSQTYCTFSYQIIEFM